MVYWCIRLLLINQFTITTTHHNVRAEGLEPPWITPPDPKSGTSANFATPAMNIVFKKAANVEITRGKESRLALLYKNDQLPITNFQTMNKSHAQYLGLLIDNWSLVIL